MTRLLRDPELVDLRDASVLALVVDSHVASRIGIGVLVHRQPWVSRCLLAADTDEARQLAVRHKPDVGIIDVTDAGPFVASYTGPLRAAHPAMPIVLTSRCRAASAAQLPGMGATAFLAPGFTPGQLVAAVRAALLAEGASIAAATPVADALQLSAREREVLALISTGATNREIAAALQVGTETVKKHAGGLYRKLRVRNRTEAAQRAAELLVA